MSTSPIIDLLIEIESAVAAIEAQPSMVDANVAAAWVSERCEKIRDALMAGDPAAAGLVGIELGERLTEIRKLGAIARRKTDLAEAESNVKRRAREKTAKRYAVFSAELNRSLSDTEAYKRAAKKLGESIKTVRRAVAETLKNG